MGIEDYETHKNNQMMAKSFENFGVKRGSKVDTFRKGGLDNGMLYRNNIDKLTQSYDQRSNLAKRGTSHKKKYQNDYDFENQRGKFNLPSNI